MKAQARSSHVSRLSTFTVVALAAFAFVTPPRTAHAGVHVSVGFGFPVVGAPVYVAPPPAPVYVAPPPVYVAPPPAVYYPHAYYAPRRVIRVAAPAWVGGYWSCGRWIPGHWR